MASVYDGFVSRHLNRYLSRPVARALARTPVTPNQVSFAALGVAAGSFVCFALGLPVAGAILAQVSSVVDGVDGDLARAKGMTSAFGGFMDSILDRYADGLILLGLTLWAASAASGAAYVWAVGFAALMGSFTVTYTRARIEHVPRNVFDRGITSAASRDVRLFIVMVGGLAGQGLITLALLAYLTHTVVILRLFYARRLLRGV